MGQAGSEAQFAQAAHGYRRMWPSGGKEQHLRGRGSQGLATPPKTADVPQSGPLFFFHTNEQTGAEDSQPKIHKWAFGEEIRGSPAKLVYLLLNQQWWSFSVQETKKDPPS